VFGLKAVIIAVFGNGFPEQEGKKPLSTAMLFT